MLDVHIINLQESVDHRWKTNYQSDVGQTNHNNADGKENIERNWWKAVVDEGGNESNQH